MRALEISGNLGRRLKTITLLLLSRRAMGCTEHWQSNVASAASQPNVRFWPLADLVPLELRIPLLEEGLDTLASVFGHRGENVLIRIHVHDRVVHRG